MQKNLSIAISTMFGIVALILSWQAYQISKDTRETVLEQASPNILLQDYGWGGVSHYSGSENHDHFSCIQGIRLVNSGGGPTSLTDYDVIVSYRDKTIQYANDRFSVYANAEDNISSAIFSFGSAIFNKDRSISEKISTGDRSNAISLPVQIASQSAIDLLLETHYVLDTSKIEFDQSRLPENNLSVSYKLRFASGQVVEVPFLACQFLQ